MTKLKQKMTTTSNNSAKSKTVSHSPTTSAHNQGSGNVIVPLNRQLTTRLLAIKNGERKDIRTSQLFEKFRKQDQEQAQNKNESQTTAHRVEEATQTQNGKPKGLNSQHSQLKNVNATSKDVKSLRGLQSFSEPKAAAQPFPSQQKKTGFLGLIIGFFSQFFGFFFQFFGYTRKPNVVGAEAMEDLNHRAKKERILQTRRRVEVFASSTPQPTKPTSVTPAASRYFRGAHKSKHIYARENYAKTLSSQDIPRRRAPQ